MELNQKMREITLYNYLCSFGDCFSLDINFDSRKMEEELKSFKSEWKPYNARKGDFRRDGLSLFSLDGGTTGEIDLDSLSEYNKKNNTNYTEMSFRTPTKCWDGLKSISGPLKSLEPYLGRSHLLRLNAGGFFPPHRDNGDSFRLISFLNHGNEAIYLTIKNQIPSLVLGQLYFLNAHLEHSAFSFIDGAIILVLNVEISEESIRWVWENMSSH